MHTYYTAVSVIVLNIFLIYILVKSHNIIGIVHNFTKKKFVLSKNKFLSPYEV